ncbi:hypothetical protein C8A05DRAFT_32451 [Staphylotrichum tortipilum]|uniref:DUF1742-domain-containing protein n=1 Tax=Staphylotrichum tortipilum TaxID=2831512 RepID=A0AAN6MP21_9PEZI|nr:hypothetical protein C8A05DRAFT_32451 [Staphylotrichum longicolle]
MSFPNEYAHRKVAEAKAKACDICFKLSSSVLITPDNKDWFYVCPAHLKDTGFCTPKIDQAAIEARKKRELEQEIERVKKEYEEKQNKKKEKEAKGDKKDEAADKNDQADKSGSDNSQKTQDKTKDETVTSTTEDDEEPRVFELKSTFYQQRLNRKRQAEIAKRNRERMQDPTYFPSVPKNIP